MLVASEECSTGVIVLQLERALRHAENRSAEDCGQEPSEEWDSGFASIAGIVLDKAVRARYEIVLFAAIRAAAPRWHSTAQLLGIFRPKLFSPAFFNCSHDGSLPPDHSACGNAHVYNGVGTEGEGIPVVDALTRVSDDWTSSTAGCIVYFDSSAAAVQKARLAGFGAVRVVYKPHRASAVQAGFKAEKENDRRRQRRRLPSDSEKALAPQRNASTAPKDSSADDDNTTQSFADSLDALTRHHQDIVKQQQHAVGCEKESVHCGVGCGLTQFIQYTNGVVSPLASLYVEPRA